MFCMVTSSIFAACDHACTQKKSLLPGSHKSDDITMFFLAKSALTSDPPQMWQSAVAGARWLVEIFKRFWGIIPANKGGISEIIIKLLYPFFGGFKLHANGAGNFEGFIYRTAFRIVEFCWLHPSAN